MANENQGASAPPVKIIFSFHINNLPSQSKAAPISGIYAIRNSVSGHLYVGSADCIGRRFTAHVSQLRRGVHHSKHLQRSWAKHGERAFEFLILEVTSEDMIAREQHFIDAINPKFNSGPCAENGMRGKRHAAESLEKMRANRRGKGLGQRTFSPAHCAALSAANAGRPSPFLGSRRTDETRSKMSVAAKRRLIDPCANPRARPVEIGGCSYPTGKHATLALGISHQRLIRLIKRGYGRYLDVPSNGVPLKSFVLTYVAPKGELHAGSRAVMIGYLRFGSVTEAAAHVGLKPSSFAYWLHKGKATYADGGPPPPMNSRYKK